MVVQDGALPTYVIILKRLTLCSRCGERTDYGVYRAPDKGEVGGSSPPRPTINHQYLCGYSHFFCLPVSRSKTHLPTICQLSGLADKGAIGTFCVCRLPTPSSRGGRQSAGWESLYTTVASLHRNKDEPDPSGLQERAPGRTAGLKIDTGMRLN